MITDADIAEGLKLDAEKSPGEWQAIPQLQRQDWEDADPLFRGGSITVPNPDGMTSHDLFIRDSKFIIHAAKHYGDALRELIQTKAKLDRVVEKCVRPCEGGYFILVGENHGRYADRESAVKALEEE